MFGKILKTGLPIVAALAFSTAANAQNVDMDEDLLREFFETNELTDEWGDFQNLRVSGPHKCIVERVAVERSAWYNSPKIDLQCEEHETRSYDLAVSYREVMVQIALSAMAQGKEVTAHIRNNAGEGGEIRSLYVQRISNE